MPVENTVKEKPMPVTTRKAATNWNSFTINEHISAHIRELNPTYKTPCRYSCRSTKVSDNNYRVRIDYYVEGIHKVDYYFIKYIETPEGPIIELKNGK